MDELTTTKRELKCWESMFERKHGRKPTKEDIRDAPAEIRDTYVRYQNLKEASSSKKREKIEKSEENDDGVFGQNLNKKYEKAPLPLAPVRLKSGLENIKPVRLCHGQRIKICKKKSSEEEQQEKDMMRKDGEKKENETTSTFNDIEAFGLRGVAISTSNKSIRPFETPNGKSVNGIRKTAGTVESRIKRRAFLFGASLKKMEHQIEPNEKASDLKRYTGSCTTMEVVPESETHDRGKSAKKSNMKEMDVESGILKNGNDLQKENMGMISLKGDIESNENIISENDKAPSLKCDVEMAQIKDTENLVNAELPFSGIPASDVQTPLKIREEHRCSDLITEREVNGNKYKEIENQRNQMKKRKVDNDMNEDVEVPDVKKLKTERVQEETRSSFEGSASIHDEYPNANSNRDDECYSDEGPSSTFEEVKIKNESTKPRTSSSSLVSDNFVRLDMKHKTYRRRGNGMTGSSHKRKAWVTMMKARGEYVGKSSWSRRRGGGGGGRGGGRGSWGGSRGGTGICFKCGKEGHWAKNCKGNQKTREIPEEDEDNPEFAPEEDEFIKQLTLERAAQMAAGVSIDDSEDGSDSPSLVVLPHHLPRPVYVPPPPPDAIEPLYETVDGNIIETPKEVFSALGQLGFSSFRSGQEQAIMRILSGVSSLVVLSTGAGKSLCYQLPAYMYYKRYPCLTLVISPLVSLMEDQIGGLPFGLKGACLHTNQTKAQRDKIVEKISSGKFAVLLLSPEALVGGSSGGGCLPSSTRLPPVAFACIDEAHCLSEWSHNFRPSYLRVCKVLRERFGVRCFLGLTATATRTTADSVAHHLGISNDAGAIIRGAAVPPNLYLSGSRDRDRDKALIELLQGPRFSQCESIIIYCTRRDVTERVATLVRTCLQHITPTVKPVNEKMEKETTKKNKKSKKSVRKAPLSWEAESYHAGMTAVQRRRVQKRFMSGELRLVVATVAFGMGLDKSDVRAIIHYNMPKSFESYVQEIGRAGRDGLPSHCHVFLDREFKDMCELRRHIYSNTVDRITVKKLVNKVFPRCDCMNLLHDQRNREKSKQEINHAKQQERDDVDQFVSDDILSQISEEQMIDKTAVVEGEGNPPETSCCKGENGENETLSLGLECDSLGNKNHENQQINDHKNSLVNTVESHSKQVNATILEDDSENSCKDIERRVCGGHDVAISVDSAVQELDMHEESIATLLCYLELHSNHWIEVLQPLKGKCTVKFYGGHGHLRAVAKRIPPIAAAIAFNEKKEQNRKIRSSLSFPVVEIADKMGWDLDPVFKELRSLQWNSSLAPDRKMSSSGQSGILVEFDDNSMHIRAPGDLSNEERDEVCDFLDDRIQAEERTQLKQLHTLYSSLTKVSCSEYWQCSEGIDKNNDRELKAMIKAYFDDQSNATQIELQNLKERRKNEVCDTELPHEEIVNWDCIARDIRGLTGIHYDQPFTGRAVARIFHGISSPCYPAEVWGRDRRFWRKHLDIDFNSLRRFAIRELMKLR